MYTHQCGFSNVNDIFRVCGKWECVSHTRTDMFIIHCNENIYFNTYICIVNNINGITFLIYTSTHTQTALAPPPPLLLPSCIRVEWNEVWKTIQILWFHCSMLEIMNIVNSCHNSNFTIVYRGDAKHALMARDPCSSLAEAAINERLFNNRTPFPMILFFIFFVWWGNFEC